MKRTKFAAVFLSVLFLLGSVPAEVSAHIYSQASVLRSTYVNIPGTSYNGYYIGGVTEGWMIDLQAINI
jgi:hypothetical protein